MNQRLLLALALLTAILLLAVSCTSETNGMGENPSGDNISFIVAFSSDNKGEIAPCG